MDSERVVSKEGLTPDLKIGILGALGSGKSTVAGLLSVSHAGCFVIEENFGQNPFLAKFYDNPTRWSFLSQSWFLISKVEQYTKLAGRGIEILDPPLEMDRIYAQTQFEMGWMTQADWSLYQRLYDTLITEKGIKSPDLYIAVEAFEEILLKRIEKRAESPGRFAERWILTTCPEYPIRLARNVEGWVERNHASKPVLVIDTGIYDCATRVGRVQVAGMAEDFIKQAFSENLVLPS